MHASASQARRRPQRWSRHLKVRGDHRWCLALLEIRTWEEMPSKRVEDTPGLLHGDVALQIPRISQRIRNGKQRDLSSPAPFPRYLNKYSLRTCSSDMLIHSM